MHESVRSFAVGDSNAAEGRILILVKCRSSMKSGATSGILIIDPIVVAGV
jgi:hypothetical protein